MPTYEGKALEEILRNSFDMGVEAAEKECGSSLVDAGLRHGISKETMEIFISEARERAVEKLLKEASDNWDEKINKNK